MQADAAGIRLVVGLGNPGAEYERTRHNIGFAVLDRLAAEQRAPWERSAKWGVYWTKLGDVLLVKPMRYMNRSGEPLLAIAQFYKVEPGEMLVVLDDLALELGRLRIRSKAATGGHNGLESVITTFGTEKISAPAGWNRRRARRWRGRLCPRSLLRRRDADRGKNHRARGRSGEMGD